MSTTTSSTPTTTQLLTEAHFKLASKHGLSVCAQRRLFALARGQPDFSNKVTGLIESITCAADKKLLATLAEWLVIESEQWLEPAELTICIKPVVDEWARKSANPVGQLPGAAVYLLKHAAPACALVALGVPSEHLDKW